MAKLDLIFRNSRQELKLDLRTCSLLLNIPVEDMYALESGRIRIDALHLYKLKMLGFDLEDYIPQNAYCVLTFTEFTFFTYVTRLSLDEKQALYSALGLYLSVLRVDGEIPDRDMLLVRYRHWRRQHLSIVS
jgi:hypothetical protein